MKKIAIILVFLAITVWALYTPNVATEQLVQKYANAESEFVSNKAGLRVHFRDQGVADGKVIVMMHGNSSSLHHYEPLVDILKNQYRLITLDFPGHGLTGAHPNDDYTYEGYADALSLVVDHLKLEEFTLVGHSMGGWVAWRYAVDNLNKLNGLILIAASGMPADPSDPERDAGIGFKLLASPIGPLFSKLSMPKSIIKKSTEASVADQSLVTDELVTTFWELLRHPENREALAIRAKQTQYRSESKADLVRNIGVNTLLIWGDKDTFVPITALSKFEDRLPSPTSVTLNNIGHMPMLEAPEEVASHMQRFLFTLDAFK